MLDAHAAVAELFESKKVQDEENRNKNSVCVRATEQGADFFVYLLLKLLKTRAQRRSAPEVAKKRRERVETVLRLRDEAFALRQNAELIKVVTGALCTTQYKNLTKLLRL